MIFNRLSEDFYFSFCAYVYLYMCTHIYAGAHACMCAGQRKTSGILCGFPAYYIKTWVSLPEPRPCQVLARLLFSTMLLPLSSLALLVYTYPGFYRYGMLGV